jgi:CHAD domain-containing protein
MLKEQILRFFTNNSNGFLEKFTLASKTADIDAIHEMRVCLKRLNTLFRMLNYTKKSNFRLKKCFKPMRQIFKKSGPVRDFQVQVVLVEQLKQIFFIDDRLSSLISDERDRLVVEYLKITKSFNLLKTKRSFKIIERYLTNWNENEIEKHLEAFERSRFLFIEKYSNPENDAFNLHCARKMIKDLAYIMEMLKSVATVDNSYLVKYKEAGHILGDWHDRAVLHDFLEQLRSQKSTSKPHDFKILDIRIKQDKENLKNKYFDLYKDWEYINKRLFL